MHLIKFKKLIPHSNLKLAVVGHVEWMTFIKVKHFPKAGIISHALNSKELPGGGGAVAAIKMTELTQERVHFFKSLGNDDIGKKCYKFLKKRGLEVHVAWRDEPTRKGVSFVDSNTDRSITVIGKRLQANAIDSLPWEILSTFDGVFVTAADSKAIKFCRKAKKLILTPRVKVEEIEKSDVNIDVLISSALDPDEKAQTENLKIKPKLIIQTEGSKGGKLFPGGQYRAIRPIAPVIDTYGCGDSFAAGVTAGMAADLEISESIKIGAKCGSICATHFGPYL